MNKALEASIVVFSISQKTTIKTRAPGKNSRKEKNKEREKTKMKEKKREQADTTQDL
jgi:hypothetical protein